MLYLYQVYKRTCLKHIHVHTIHSISVFGNFCTEVLLTIKSFKFKLFSFWKDVNVKLLYVLLILLINS